MTDKNKEALDNIVSLATLQVGSFGTIEQYNRVVQDTKILRAALSSPAVPVIEGLEEAIKYLKDSNGEYYKNLNAVEFAAIAYAALPKMQKVDLDGMRSDLIQHASNCQRFSDGFLFSDIFGGVNPLVAVKIAERLFDAFKSKYGELYAVIEK